MDFEAAVVGVMDFEAAVEREFITPCSSTNADDAHDAEQVVGVMDFEAAVVGVMDFEAAVERVIGGLEKKGKVLTKEERTCVAYHEERTCVAYNEVAP
ncbi:hypothetical protein T484DRAFT_1832130 [Baffinella frigidus]|nr:hypothetical protein T484DRAFT_1832130 [Cryptophyta sp. CCMP2293]